MGEVEASRARRPHVLLWLWHLLEQMLLWLWRPGSSLQQVWGRRHSHTACFTLYEGVFDLKRNSSCTWPPITLDTKNKTLLELCRRTFSVFVNLLFRNSASRNTEIRSCSLTERPQVHWWNFSEFLLLSLIMDEQKKKKHRKAQLMFLVLQKHKIFFLNICKESNKWNNTFQNLWLNL